MIIAIYLSFAKQNNVSGNRLMKKCMSHFIHFFMVLLYNYDPVNTPIARKINDITNQETPINISAIATFLTVVYHSSTFLVSLAYTSIVTHWIMRIIRATRASKPSTRFIAVLMEPRRPFTVPHPF